VWLPDWAWLISWVWHHVPFRVTEGWGSVGTVIVGVAAIIAASYWNRRALERSAETLRLAEKTYQRTEELHEADRIESRNQKLRDALFSLSRTLWRCSNAAAQHVRLLKRLAELLSTGANQERRDDIQLQIQDSFEALRAVATDTLLDLQTALILSDSASLKSVGSQIINDVKTTPDKPAATNLTDAEAVLAAASQLGKPTSNCKRICSR
jgi:hypothetical protein